MDVCKGKAMEGSFRVVGQVWVIVIRMYKHVRTPTEDLATGCRR